MKGIKYGFKTLFYNKFAIILISIFMSFLSGYILNMGVTYLYAPHLFPYIFYGEYIYIQILFLFLVSFSFTIVIKKVKFDRISAIWTRIIFSIIMPLCIGFIYIIIFGNDKIMIQMNVYHLIEFFDIGMLVVTIISGQIFLKPWKSLLNFAIGTLYVALMYTIQIYYIFLIVGTVYDKWL